jgi:hypothetical protein
MSLLASIAKYVPPTGGVTVKRMTRIGNQKQLRVVNNTDQVPIQMTITPKTQIWSMRNGAQLEDQFEWVVAINPGQAEPDIQAGDVLTGYREKTLQVRSANFYDGPYPYLGGILTTYSHRG